MSTGNDIDDSSAPLIEHLAELRTRLIRSLMAFVVGMLICFMVWNPIFNFLTDPICAQLAQRGQDCGLILIKLQEGFFVAIRISLLGGFILSFPYISYQLWRFVAPGLYRSEKNAFLPFLISSPAMFFLGAAFAFYIVLPLAFDFFLGFQQVGGLPVPANVDEVDLAPLANAGITFQGSVDEYLSLTIKFILAFGLCFQLPVLLTLMGKAGLVSAHGLRGVRKYAVVGILVLAALVTPPDVITQVILFVVVYGLYEISIFLVARVERKRVERMRAEGLLGENEDLWGETEDEFAVKDLETDGALARIADALERIAPPAAAAPHWDEAEAFVWHVAPDRLAPVKRVNRVALPLLLGIDRARDILLENTLQFARGLPANNALLWGARGMGKSSLVKAIHAEICETDPLKIVEVQREDLPSIGRLLTLLRAAPHRFILFCDDLSFSHDDQHYKSLKAVLDGGIEGRPENVVFYATSNRRHLMPRDMIENERSTAISPSEAVEEKVSLSDRFGLWLGFHPCTQDEYLAMVRGYCDAHGVEISDAELRAEAIEWQATRGSRSGRVAWQFFTDLAGRRGASL